MFTNLVNIFSIILPVFQLTDKAQRDALPTVHRTIRGRASYDAQLEKLRFEVWKTFFGARATPGTLFLEGGKGVLRLFYITLPTLLYIRHK